MGKERLPEIALAAIQCEALAGLPAGIGSVVAAQCILESGWLDHAPGNNCFGIKEFKGQYGRQLLHTTEWFTDAEQLAFTNKGDYRTAYLIHPVETNSRGSKKYNVTDWFARFRFLGDCFAKRGGLFKVGAYAVYLSEFHTTGDLPLFVRSISKTYATDPNYADKILALVQQSDVQTALTVARVNDTIKEIT